MNEESSWTVLFGETTQLKYMMSQNLALSDRDATTFKVYRLFLCLIMKCLLNLVALRELQVVIYTLYYKSNGVLKFFMCTVIFPL